ncbi:MAG: hypothetical protein Q9162_000030 [Coniocarpon cinnabarinum]
MSDSPHPTIPVSPNALRTLILSILTSPQYGVPQKHAETVCEAMLTADLTGHDTHGCQRLPSYLRRIREGVMNATANPIVTYPAPAVAAVDGQNTFGHVAVAAAMDAAMDLAEKFGVGMAGVKHSNHFGAASWVIERATARDFAAVVFTNSSPALPPYGGREKLLGVSPLAAGFPGTTSGATGATGATKSVKPFVLDMAPSVAARGKVIKALRRNESIPAGWALDRDGKPTTDPAAALEGTMLPIGGPKGSALSILMDVFSGVMTGAAFAGTVASPYDPSRPADVGHFVVAMKPDLFVDRSELHERLGKLWTSVTESTRGSDVDRIWFPGEKEQETRERRLTCGIPLTQHEIDILNDEAFSVRVTPLITQPARTF